MIIQTYSGFSITIQYTSDIIASYYSIQYLDREVYYGWYFYNLHSNGASFIFITSLIHISRGLYISSYLYRNSLWLSGIVLFLLLMTTAFLGYILAWGQLSYWGGTVISNIFITCSLTLSIIGASTISNPTIHRFLVFHILISLHTKGLTVVHIFYLHWISSSNTLGFYTNTLTTFYPIVLLKDILGLILLGLGYTLQIFISYCLNHPDNILEVNALITPLHIVPEWYFLHLYMQLKSTPNRTTGLMISILYILNLSVFNESINLLVITYINTSYNWIHCNLASNSLIYNTITTLFLGAQLPQQFFL